MPSTPHGSAVKGAVAVGLLIAGLACAAMFRVLVGTEHHSYDSGSVARPSAHVTANKLYLLSVPGGVRSLQKQGVDVSAPRCTYTLGDAAVRTLTVQAEGTGTKATNAVGTFFAPETGSMHVDCLGWGALFIDNADDASPDISGWMLVLGVLALTVGFGLGVSALRSAGGEADESGGAPRDDEEIERLVHLVHVRAQDGEVGGDDGDDVLA